MKSAYELAMERLEKQSPTVKVTEAQRAEIADLDTLYKSKVAEREVFLRGKIEAARASGNHEEQNELEQELARDIRRLNQDCEEKKERVRQGGKK